jgi:hypothetical protein
MLLISYINVKAATLNQIAFKTVGNFQDFTVTYIYEMENVLEHSAQRNSDPPLRALKSVRASPTASRPQELKRLNKTGNNIHGSVKRAIYR